MKRFRIFTLLSVFSLALASLACTMFVGGPGYPETPVAVSTETVGELEQQIHAAQTSAAQSGNLSFSMNESQVTSLLAAKLAEQADPLITEPQVYLRNGEIQVFGKAVKGNFQANVRVVFAITLDAEGKPVISVTSADFGPLPAPEGLNGAISALVDEAFTGTLGPAALGFRLENISIADGVMTVTGRIK
jgi:hypothetical protein